MGSTAGREFTLSAAAPVPDAVPVVVLDTNVALDWLVFQNPAVLALAAAITQGELIWIACPAMRDELSHMLNHHSLARWEPDVAAGMAVFDRHARLLPPAQVGAAHRLVCTDADDQVFIDLAVAQGASALLTHDRALLKLARRAQRLGVRVLKPADWPELA